jgi:predicted ribosomally synthesized peptide with nif11-like leader
MVKTTNSSVKEDAMSMEAVEKFFDKAEQDESLKKELASWVEGYEDVSCVHLTTLAADHGFEFTPEELHDAIEEVRKKEEGGQELTDEDLENVAGGRSFRLARIPRFVPGLRMPMMRLLYGIPGSSGAGSANVLYGVPCNVIYSGPPFGNR